MFDLKRPCNQCPFRREPKFHLRPERVEEIRDGIAFQCHKTIDYDQFDDTMARQGDRPQQCAGVMAIHAREGTLNRIMGFAVYLGELDLDALDPQQECYNTWDEAIEGMR